MDEKEKQREETTMRKKRILLIDDEPSFTRMLKLNLEETGAYEVREENRGKVWSGRRQGV